MALSRLGRPLEGIDIDPRRVRDLSRRVGPHVCISEGYILRHAPPTEAVIVSNIPFHLTTPVLRHLLSSAGWRSAIVITQWEVARKRAGVGGATQLTAQWWPWHEFSLDRRISASAFRPRPSVDAGLLVIDRRSRSLVPMSQRRSYQVNGPVAVICRQSADGGVLLSPGDRRTPPNLVIRWLERRPRRGVTGVSPVP